MRKWGRCGSLKMTSGWVKGNELTLVRMAELNLF